MVQLNVCGKTYKVEFRHVTKLGKRRELYARAPIKAITTCVVVALDDNFIAIDNAICAEGDNFSRKEGRNRAFNKVLAHHTPLREIKSKLLGEYLKQTNQFPTKEIQKPAISEAERRKRIDAGSSVREHRKKTTVRFSADGVFILQDSSATL